MLPQQIAEILRTKPFDSRLFVSGWIKTRRDSGAVSFIELSDGSCLANLQVIAGPGLGNFERLRRDLTTGASIRVRGLLVPSPAQGQEVELRAEEIEILGTADPESYPLQKKRHSFEFLRTIPQLRPRTNALASVARVRSCLNYAVHRFFCERGFFQVHTPIITTSDCEGAGEMFTVTVLAPGELNEKEGFARDFFGRRAGLTVSGQLQAEIYALALGRVYTFGPTFRAENSNTSRHLAEFWMLEPEMAFCDLQGDMEIAEELIRYLVSEVRRECAAEIGLFARFIDRELPARLERIASKPFARLSYGEAVDRLIASGASFEFPVAWGMDLQSEHERYLCEKIIGGPVIVSDYPLAIKPFYMRLNDDRRTVAAMDILVPGIGELVGGSQREERYDVLAERMAQVGLKEEDYGWYLDLRRYGSVPHAGFGLGFERLVQLVTGMQNIREAIPFPRTPGSAPC
ncbi:MAG TPA: asparagine--tRNA ligase [Desulfobulbaceae bacterium]|nr:asparagine--tRNA ligase [Desulfobulbaceae bacterium]